MSPAVAPIVNGYFVAATESTYLLFIMSFIIHDCQKSSMTLDARIHWNSGSLLNFNSAISMDPILFSSLVFMGSEKHPYKGILDLFANRGFSRGTDAWTATDHTAYTVSAAGEQGFLQLLPIYVDHILYPTITNARYVVLSFIFCIILII